MQSWECWIVLSPISAICDQPVVLARPPNPPIPLGIGGLRAIWAVPKQIESARLRCLKSERKESYKTASLQDKRPHLIEFQRDTLSQIFSDALMASDF